MWIWVNYYPYLKLFPWIYTDMKHLNAMSDQAILAELGERLARFRLNANISQKQLASEAGISRKTVYNAESGQSIQMESLIRILRALGQLANLNAFLPNPEISPISLADRKGKVRQHAYNSDKNKVAEQKTEWVWPEDQK